MDKNERAQINSAKKLLESHGYKVEPMPIEFLLNSEDCITLEEHIRIHGNEFSWEETLEESLLTDEDFVPKGDQTEMFNIGDIIMATGVYSKESQQIVSDPHRILVITAKESDDDIIKYRGFLLSSQVKNSNKYRKDKYPNSIYIADYATILDRGNPVHKEAVIQLGKPVEFTNKNLSVSGTWKGKVSREFLSFVRDCYTNARNNVSNADTYWE